MQRVVDRFSSVEGSGDASSSACGRGRSCLLVVGQAGSALAGASAGNGPGGAAASAPIGKGLIEALNAKKLDRFVVEFSTKADLRGASKVKGHDARGKWVLDTLTATSKKSQAAASAVAKKAGVKFENYWLYNEMIVQGDAKLAAQFAKLKGVSAVRALKIYPLVKPVPNKNVILEASGDPEWGVEKIGAPDVWDEGIVGQGVVSRTSTPASTSPTRPSSTSTAATTATARSTTTTTGGTPPASAATTPCDNVGHGTHTMGTMVGGDGPGPFTPDVGVAPGARWIAAKGCEPTSAARGRRSSRPASSSSPRPTWTARTPTRRSGPTSSTTRGAAAPATPSTSRSSRRGARPGSSRCSRPATPARSAARPDRPATSSRCSASAPPTSTTTSPTSRAAARPSYGKINPDITAPGVDVTSSVPGRRLRVVLRHVDGRAAHVAARSP